MRLIVPLRKECFNTFSYMNIRTRGDPYQEASNSLLVARPQLEVPAMIIVSLSPYLHSRCRRVSCRQRWCTTNETAVVLYVSIRAQRKFIELPADQEFP